MTRCARIHFQKASHVEIPESHIRLAQGRECTRPRKERQDCPRMSLTISVIQVIRGRIIKIHRQFHESEPEHTRVEIDICLWFSGNCSHVMQSFNAGHDVSPSRVSDISSCLPLRTGLPFTKYPGGLPYFH